MLRAAPGRTPRRQRGLSIVELMVGVAIGLFVVAAASMLVATQLSDNRRLMLETQVQQDLRATADIITRELRRAGHWGKARDGVWSAGNTALIRDNRYSRITKDVDSDFADGEESSTVLFAYSRSGKESDENGTRNSAEELGFERVVADGKGVIWTYLGAANPQPLTDSNTLDVTEFKLTMNVQPIRLECPNPCPDPLVDCRPELQVRDVRIDITGRAAHDSSVQRSLSSNVRLRNDAVIAGTCPA